MRTRLLFTFAAIALFGVTAGCGGDDGESSSGRPPKDVPADLVPAALQGGKYVTRPDEQAKEAFTRLDNTALIDDGRLWQIRQASDDRLIGTLQISTVAARVDLLQESQRRSLVNHILPGSKQEIEVSGLDIWASESNEKLVYVWFARDLFEVLQLKGTNIDPEAIVEEIVALQIASPNWNRLPQPSEGEELLEEEEG